MEGCVVSYGSTNIYLDAYEALRDGGWLPDSILQFYCEFLEESHSTIRGRLYIVCPVVCMSLTCGDLEGARCIFEGSDLVQSDVVLVPLNDNTDLDVACGGSHWSLLTFERSRLLFQLFDSSPSNADGAMSVAASRAQRRLEELLGLEGKTTLRRPRCAPQADQVSCGVYTLFYARMACEETARGEAIGSSGAHERVTPREIARFRRSLVEEVESLRKRPSE